MAAIQLTGHVDGNGRLELSKQIDLPPGDVLITIESVNAEDEAAEAAFDELLARPRSQTFLAKMAKQVLAEYEAGLTEEFDPDDLP